MSAIITFLISDPIRYRVLDFRARTREGSRI